jgi:uncharacterized protein (TIGR02145 family)
MKKTILLLTGLAFFTFKNQAQTVTDIDGNVYNTVTIGTQVWMKENLKVTHYRNGDSIPLVTDNTAWMGLTAGAYCDYNNTPGNSATYGRLYNWYTVVDPRSLCPADWHVPTRDEFEALTAYLGGEFTAGYKLREAGTVHWTSPNAGATNQSNFTALPGGDRSSSSGMFFEMGNWGFFWSTTILGGYYQALDLYYNDATANVVGDNKLKGCSVRCCLNNSGGVQDINQLEKLQIYPNPVFDRVYINYNETKNAKMQIYNVVGECVLQRELRRGTNEIDISSLPKGIYIIRLIGEDNAFQQKLIKE